MEEVGFIAILPETKIMFIVSYYGAKSNYWYYVVDTSKIQFYLLNLGHARLLHITALHSSLCLIFDSSDTRELNSILFGRLFCVLQDTWHVPGFFPLDASSTSPLSCDNQNVPWGAKSPPVETH